VKIYFLCILNKFPLIAYDSGKLVCTNLQKLESGRGKDILPIMIDGRRKYVDCQQRHAAVISIIEKPSK